MGNKEPQQVAGNPETDAAVGKPGNRVRDHAAAKIRKLWSWIRDKDNRATVRFLAAGAASVIGAGWVVFAHFDKKPVDVVINFTAEQYQAMLADRSKVIAQHLKAADEGQRLVANAERIALESKNTDAQRAVVEFKTKLAEAYSVVNRVKQTLPRKDVERAKSGLQSGNAESAKAVLTVMLEISRDNAAEAAHQLGDLAEGEIRFAEARTYYLKAAELRPEHVGYARDAARIAEVTGRYAEAIIYTKKALELMRRAGTAAPVEIGSATNRLANLYRFQAQFDLAEATFSEALSLLRSSPKQVDLAVATSDYGGLFWAWGKYSRAEELYLTAITLLESSQGRDNIDYATMRNNLALLYAALGRFVEARAIYQSSLELTRTLQKRPDEPLVLTLKTNLAEVYRELGDYSQARSMLEEIRQLAEKSLEANHPRLSRLFNAMGRLLHLQERWKEAESFYDRARVISNEAFGRSHYLTAHILLNLADLYNATGRASAARDLVMEARAIIDSTPGSQLPLTVTALTISGETHQRLSRREEAKQDFRTALRVGTDSLGGKHPVIARILVGLARAEAEERRYETAENLLARAQAVAESAFGSSHPFMAEIFEGFSAVLRKMRHYDDAETYLRKAITISAGVLGPDSERVARLKDELIKTRHELKNFKGIKTSRRACLPRPCGERQGLSWNSVVVDIGVPLISIVCHQEGDMKKKSRGPSQSTGKRGRASPSHRRELARATTIALTATLSIVVSPAVSAKLQSSDSTAERIQIIRSAIRHGDILRKSGASLKHLDASQKILRPEQGWGDTTWDKKFDNGRI